MTTNPGTPTNVAKWTKLAPANDIADGVRVVTTAGTDVALSASSVPCVWVAIQAQTDNTGKIAIGNSGVDATVATGTGILLSAGDTMVIEIRNLNLIYLDATVSGEGVRYTYGI